MILQEGALILIFISVLYVCVYLCEYMPHVFRYQYGPEEYQVL